MKDSQAIHKNGRLVGWICKYCKLYNDALTNHCKACYVYKPDWLTSYLQGLIAIQRGIFINWRN